MAGANVLVVDDDGAMAELCADVARDYGHTASCAPSATEALSALETGEYDLVVSDVRMPQVDGIELIGQIRARDPEIAVIAMTAFGSIDTAVRAVRAGAWDYLAKPFQPADLALRVESALARRAMSLELGRLRSAVSERDRLTGMVGKSRAILEVASLVKRVADTPSTVLVTGPSGSGKELVARALHDESRRRDGPFVPVNCAAIPPALLEAELFGARKGAYTDARVDRAGMFQTADGGTLFLDEIGELDVGLQAKLLRVLQEREVRPVGSPTAQPIDVRVVAATNRDLRGAVAERSFREDLFYRLAVIEIAVPALRERPDDIMPLAEHFLARVAARAGKPVSGFSPAASKLLIAYAWPGNVRELENAVERAVALSAGPRIGADELPATVRARHQPTFLDDAAERMVTLAELERSYARLILQRTRGNKLRAATILGVDRRTLQRWFGDAEEARGRDES
jgi:DNA-binding NtrC family response regulator